MTYKVIRIIGVVLLVLGAVAIVLQIMAGGKVINWFGAGGTPILIGGILLGRSFRLENKNKASGDPSDMPK